MISLCEGNAKKAVSWVVFALDCLSISVGRLLQDIYIYTHFKIYIYIYMYIYTHTHTCIVHTYTHTYIHTRRRLRPQTTRDMSVRAEQLAAKRKGSFGRGMRNGKQWHHVPTGGKTRDLSHNTNSCSSLDGVKWEFACWAALMFSTRPARQGVWEDTSHTRVQQHAAMCSCAET